MRTAKVMMEFVRSPVRASRLFFRLGTVKRASNWHLASMAFLLLSAGKKSDYEESTKTAGSINSLLKAFPEKYSVYLVLFLVVGKKSGREMARDVSRLEKFSTEINETFKALEESYFLKNNECSELVFRLACSMNVSDAKIVFDSFSKNILALEEKTDGVRMLSDIHLSLSGICNAASKKDYSTVGMRLPSFIHMLSYKGKPESIAWALIWADMLADPEKFLSSFQTMATIFSGQARKNADKLLEPLGNVKATKEKLYQRAWSALECAVEATIGREMEVPDKESYDQSGLYDLSTVFRVFLRAFVGGYDEKKILTHLNGVGTKKLGNEAFRLDGKILSGSTEGEHLVFLDESKRF